MDKNILGDFEICISVPLSSNGLLGLNISIFSQRRNQNVSQKLSWNTEKDAIARLL